MVDDKITQKFKHNLEKKKVMPFPPPRKPEFGKIEIFSPENSESNVHMENVTNVKSDTNKENIIDKDNLKETDESDESDEESEQHNNESANMSKPSTTEHKGTQLLFENFHTENIGIVEAALLQANFVSSVT